MLIDLHVHSRYTPGCDLDPERVIQRAEAVGLEGVCFTDLNTLEGAAEIHALRARTRIAVLVGVKIATDHGHYLGYFPDPENTADPAQVFGSPAGKGWPARDVIESIRARGGVAVAAYPYDREIERPSGDFIFTLKGLTAIEAWNGRRRSNVNELAIEAADHLSLPCVGGSGAFAGYEEIGTGATLLRDEVRDERALVEVLKAGASWAVAIGTPPRFMGDEAAREERRGRDERRGPGAHRPGDRGGRGRGGRRRR